MAEQAYLVVYADVVLLTNFCLDFLTLWLAGRLTGRPGRPRWLAAAAFLGAAGALAAELWPYSLFNSLSWKLLLAGLMVLMGLRPKGKRWFIRQLTGFFLAAFALGGAAFGLAYLAGGAWNGLAEGRTARQWAELTGLPVQRLLALWLGAAALFCIAAVTFVARRLRHSAGKGTERTLAAELFWQGTKGRLYILLDTGSQLYEPVSGLPVLVLSPQALSSGLPLARVLAEQNLDLLPCLRCRSVSGKGMLPLLGRARLVFDAGEELDCCLALASLPLDDAGDYDALLPASAYDEPPPKESPPSHAGSDAEEKLLIKKGTNRESKEAPKHESSKELLLSSVLPAAGPAGD